LENLSNLNAVDRRIREAFEFKDAEWVLIEDLFDVTLADFKGDESSPGRLRTRRNLETGDEPQLRLYCEYFIRVLKAGFGPDKKIVATVFHENGKELLPYRLVAIHLNSVEKDQIRIQSYDSLQLLAELETVNRKWLKQKTSKSGSIYSQRVARIYDDSDGNPTIYIFKPDAYRYWTRSMGLHDADEVAADFARWNAEKRRGKTVW
jgi:hypothetical protein